MKKTLILAFAITLLITLSGKNLFAQTKEDAGNAFNAALELSKTDLPGAIVKMQEVLKMTTALGAEGDTLKGLAGNVLPVWQYNIGNNLIKEKKYSEAIAAYEKSGEFATTFSDENIKEKSENMLVKLYASEGNRLKAEKPDDALVYLDKALKLDPDFSKAFFSKGQVYKNKGDNVKMVENMELAIKAAKKSNDTITENAAQNAIGMSLYQEGKTAFTKKAYGEATEKLNKALTYEIKNKELYYLLATSYNNLKKYDEAIQAAESGLPMEDQAADKLARFYYEIAKAYEGKKDVANACANYKKSAIGTFKSSAEYQMKTVLKCQ